MSSSSHHGRRRAVSASKQGAVSANKGAAAAALKTKLLTPGSFGLGAAAAAIVCGVLVSGGAAGHGTAEAGHGPGTGKSVSVAESTDLSFARAGVSTDAGPAAKHSSDVSAASSSVEPVDDPQAARQYAKATLDDFGWGQDQMRCLQSLWNRESDWRTSATNPSSLAYGIAQALPATKMDKAGDDWKTNYRTQIKWGLNYIQDRYGSPCGAWQHELAANWY